jgi:hypothetical protein
VTRWGCGLSLTQSNVIDPFDDVLSDGENFEIVSLHHLQSVDVEKCHRSSEVVEGRRAMAPLVGVWRRNLAVVSEGNSQINFVINF